MQKPPISEVLLCYLCKKVYKDPRVLNCKHVFCFSCLEKKIKNGIFQCLLCDSLNQINNLESLPKDDLIRLTLDTLKLEHFSVNCQECERNEAKLFCENCTSSLCEGCSSKIHRLNINKNHTFSEIKKENFGYCKTHQNKEIEMICKTCNSLLCLKCSVLEHKTHDLQDLKVDTKSAIAEFKENAHLRQKIELTLKNLEIFERNREKQKLDFEDFEAELNEIKNIILALETKLKEMRTSFETIRNDKMTVFKNQMIKLSTQKTKMGLYELLFENFEKIDNFSKLQTSIQDLKREFSQNQIHDESEIIQLLSNKDSIEQIKKLVQGLKVQIVENIGTKYHFTTLGATGRFGPISLEGYKNTPLDLKVNLFNGIQEWRVPCSGEYRISAAGAAGGIGNRLKPCPGKGAIIEGNFELKKGELLRIVVGQKGCGNPKSGYSSGGGGGGGTFISNFAKNQHVPIIVAGGGNGDSFRNFTTNGVSALNFNHGDIPGKRTTGRAGAGGSFSHTGEWYNDSCAGLSFINGSTGGEKYPGNHGADGGFGGGGGCQAEGGGGGGYSGGSVVPENDFEGKHEDFGAGSFNIGKKQNNKGGMNDGDGFVIIERIEVKIEEKRAVDDGAEGEKRVLEEGRMKHSHLDFKSLGGKEKKI